MNSPTREEELVVELNSDLVKTIESMQAYLQSFKDDKMNERKEQKAINEALLRNMMGVHHHAQPTHSPINPRKNMSIKEGPVVLRKMEKKNPHLIFQKKNITVFLVKVPYHLAEKGRKMMTIFKENFER